MIEESHAAYEIFLTQCRWIIDGMAAIRSVNARKTYREWLECLMKFVNPSEDKDAISIEIINDTYKRDSVELD